MTNALVGKAITANTLCPHQLAGSIINIFPKKEMQWGSTLLKTVQYKKTQWRNVFQGS